MSNLTQGEELTDESIISRLEPVSIENIIPEAEKKIYPITGVLQTEPKTPLTPIERGDFLQGKAYLASKINPDQAARREKQKRFTEIDIPSMHGDDEALKMADEWEQDKRTSLNDWYRASEDYPGLTKSIRDFNQLAIVSDDLENLSWFERQLVMSKKGFASGKSQLKLAELASKERERVRLTGVWDNKNDLEYKKINDELSTNQVNTMNLLYNTSSVLPMMVGSLVEGFKGNINGSLPTYALGMGISVLTRGRVNPEQVLKAAQTVGKGTGTLAAVSYTANIEGAFAFEQYKNLKTVDGQRLDPKKVIAVSDWVGLAAGTLEATGTFIIAKTMSKPILAMLSKELSRIPGADNLGKVISNNPDKFAGLTLQKALQLAGKEYLKSIAAETSTEFGQEVISNVIGQGVLQIGADKQIVQPTILERLGKSLEVIPKTISSTALLAGAGAGAKFAELKPSIQSVKKQAELVSDINEAVAYKKELGETMDTYNRSTTTKRDRETGLKIITDIAKEHGKDKVYWDKTEAKNVIDQIVNDYIEKADIPLTQDEVLERTGLDVLYQKINDENEQNIDHIEMPLNELMNTNEQVQSITGTDFYKAIKDDVSSSPAQSTYRQAMEHYKNVEQEWDDILDEQVKLNEQETLDKNNKQTIINKIKSQLINVGEKESVADTQSKLAAEMIYQESLRSGLPIDAVSEKLIPKIIKIKPTNINSTRKIIREQVLQEVDFSLINRVKKLLGKTNKIYIPLANRNDYIESIKRAGLTDRVTYDRKESATDFDTLIQQIDDTMTVNEFFDELDKTKRWSPRDIKTEVEKRVQSEMQEIQALESKARGFVDIENNKKSVITLFSSKNESTFLHEFSHIFLNNRFEFIKSGVANEGYLNDWKTLTEWLDIKENQEKLTDEQQEKFASGFEAYLKHAEAPSPILKRVFATVRKWMTRIYQSLILPEDMRILQLDGWIIDPSIRDGVKISPNVKAVMDRMLASDLAIENMAKYSEINKSLKDIGFSNLEIKAINDLRDEGKEDAITKILIQQFKELTPEYKKQKAEFQKAIYDKHSKLVKQEKVYQALDYITLESGLSHKQILDSVIENQANLAALDIFAKKLNYESGRILYEEIKESKPMGVEINDRAEAEFNERYQDLRLSPEFDRKALAALHNSKIIESLALESKLMESLSEEVSELEKQARKDNKKTAFISKEEYQDEARKAKRLAKEYFEDKPINLIEDPEFFSKQERNAAINSRIALKNGDMPTALKWKRKQMFNFALSKEASRLKKIVDKQLEYLVKTEKYTSKQIITRFKNEELAMQIGNILKRFGFNPEWLNDYDLKNRVTLLEYSLRPKDEIEDAILAIPDLLLDEKFNADVNTLTIDQLEDVVNGVKNLKKVNDAMTRGFTEGIKQDRLAEAEDLITDGNKNLSGLTKAKKSQLSSVKSLWEKIDTVVDYLESRLVNLERTLDFMGGFKGINGSWYRAFYGRIYNARQAHLKLMSDAEKAYSDLFKKHYPKQLDKDALYGYTIKNGKLFRDKKYIPELGEHLIKSDLISIFWNMGNETNKARLVEGRDIGLDESDYLEAIQNHLTENDMEFAQSVLDWINSYWEPVSNLYKDLTGFSPKKVEATPIILYKDGKRLEYNGGYFPLKKDFSSSNLTIDEIKKDEALESGDIIRMMTKNDHTKARVRNAKYPVLLDFNIPIKHIESVIHDLAFRKAMLDLNWLIKNKDIQEFIRSKFGQNTVKKFAEVISLIANAGRSEKIGATQIYLNAFRKNVTVSLMLGKLSIAFQNLSNLILFANVDDNFGVKDIAKALPDMPKYIVHSLKFNKRYAQSAIKQAINKQLENPNHMNEMLDFVIKRSPVMQRRFSEGAERDLITRSENLFGRLTAQSKLFSGIIMYTDKIVAIPIWRAAYDKIIAQSGSEKQAIQFADLIIRNGLGSNLPEDMSLVMQGNAFQKMFTMFYSFMNNAFGLQVQQYRKSRYGKTNNKRISAIANLSAMVLIVPLLSELLAMRPPDNEDDENTWLWAMSAITRSQAGLLPGIREVSNYLNSRLKYGYGDFNSPLLSATEKILSSGYDIAFEDFTPLEKIEKASKATGLISGFPQIGIDETFNMIDYINGDNELDLRWLRGRVKD